MKKIVNGILLIGLCALLAIWIFVDIPLFSPFSTESSNQQQTNENTKKIYGFLPYWNLDKVSLQPELTDLAYFSLTINDDGTIKTKDDDGNLDPGYYKLQSEEFSQLQNQTLKQNKKTQIVLSLLENKKITNFLQSEESLNNFFESLDSLLLAYPFTGLNLDIEYAGEASDDLRNNYSEFVKNLSTHLKNKYPDIEFSIDTYAAAATKKMLWDIKKIHQYVDYIVVMAYDFNQAHSTQAGPVAPLFNKDNSWQESIHSYLSNFAKQVPTQKILLGIPFYGYEWQTTNREPQAFTLPKTGATASYKRVKELIAQKDKLQLETHWDETALEPYLTYTKDEKFFTIYYENPESLKYKLDYVNQLDLAGIAIWSLGYEGDSREFWEVIHQQLLLPEQATNSTNQ